MSAPISSSAVVLPVARPPVSPHPPRVPPTRRPPAFQVEEPVFVGVLTVLSLAAGLFWAWVVLTPSPEPALLDADAVGLVRDLPPPVRLTLEAPPVPPLALPPEPAPVGRRAPRAEPSAPVPSEEVAPSSEPPRSLLLEQIGTLGPGRTALETVLGPDDEPGFRQAIAGVTGAREASADGGLRQMGRGRDASVGIGSLGSGDVGTGVVAAPTVRARVVDEPAATTASGGDAALIARTVRASQGRIVTCLERALKADPTVNGRISVGWTIRAGRVVEPSLVANTTSDAELGACVLGAVRTFNFPRTLDAEVAEFPWVVAGG